MHRLPPPVVRRLGVPQVRSLALHHWESAALSLDADTGQSGTLVRASAGDCTDSVGAVVTVPHSMPRWHAGMWLDDAAVGLRLDGDDLTWPVEWRPGTQTYLLQFWEGGARETEDAGLLYVGRDDGTGVRLLVDSDGADYRATLVTGAGSESAAVTAGVPATGQPASLLVWLEDDGTNQRVQLHLTAHGTAGVASSAWTAPLARASAWGGEARLRLNRVGSAGTQGAMVARRVAVFPGLLQLHEVMARR